MSDLMQFLDVLHGDLDDGYLELRALPSKRQRWVPLREVQVSGAVETFVEDCRRRRENAYFGVAVRHHDHAGDKAACSWLPALYADLDIEDLDVARQRLAAFPLPATAIVQSGGGLHAYWRLHEPYDLRDVAHRAEAEAYLRRLARALDCDTSVAECARVLRLPSSTNYKPKYPAPRPVTLAYVIH